MKSLAIPFYCSVLIFFAFNCSDNHSTKPVNAKSKSDARPLYTIVIHGGAGTILKANMSPEKEAAYTNALNAALHIGEEILKNGGTALQAVEKTINYMEDSPLFNAGKGAVFTNAGTNELDASIMDGATQNAGAVAGVKIIKNPISAAVKVMEDSPHVLLSGGGADRFAIEEGLDTVPNSYFFTERQWEAIEKIRAEEGNKTGQIIKDPTDSKFGTVGCVALDQNGNIAAGTSTGGMTNKRWGRIGDSPIIGAGTYADNATCAVSCTGHGEFFIRYTVAADVAARMAYLKEPLQVAADFVVNKKLVEKGGEGGLIALDAKGNIAMVFNSEGMYRGYAKPGIREVKIYKD
ncbi:MAG: isoaspartyl peptidase/L-asparaginase [Saprospiraceae bacterium]|nr:MAG: isoaspartyl peptidase/L-asparaginase [Saprospiraceae bacterium]